MSPYKFLAENKLIVETDSFRIECSYECNWNNAEWKLDIGKIAGKDGCIKSASEISRELIALLRDKPIGYGKVIVLHDGKILANMLLSRG